MVSKSYGANFNKEPEMEVEPTGLWKILGRLRSVLFDVYYFWLAQYAFLGSTSFYGILVGR